MCPVQFVTHVPGLDPRSRSRWFVVTYVSSVFRYPCIRSVPCFALGRSPYFRLHFQSARPRISAFSLSLTLHSPPRTHPVLVLPLFPEPRPGPATCFLIISLVPSARPLSPVVGGEGSGRWHVVPRVNRASWVAGPGREFHGVARFAPPPGLPPALSPILPPWQGTLGGTPGRRTLGISLVGPRGPGPTFLRRTRFGPRGPGRPLAGILDVGPCGPTHHFSRSSLSGPRGPGGPPAGNRRVGPCGPTHRFSLGGSLGPRGPTAPTPGVDPPRSPRSPPPRTLPANASSTPGRLVTPAPKALGGVRAATGAGPTPSTTRSPFESPASTGADACA